jgi:hypothetical protein
MSTKPLVLALALAAASFAALAPARAGDEAGAADKIELKLSVKPGEVFHFRQTQSVVQKMKVGEMDVDTNFEMKQTMTYTVGAARPDGLTDVKVTIGDIKGTFENSMLGNFEIDSTKEDDEASANPMLGPALKGLTMLANKSYHVVFDASGKLVEVKGMREIIDAALKDNPAFAGRSMGGMLDDDGMKQQMQAGFAVFSDGPVAVGSTWKVDSKIKSPAEMTVSTEYTLASADAATAVVKSKSTIDASIGEAGDKPKINTEGTITVSRADGLMLKSENTTTTVSDMSLGRQAGGAAGQKMHMEMTMKAVIERVAAADVAKPAPKPDAAPKTPAPTKSPDDLPPPK